MMERINPLNDYIFKKILGEEGTESQLISFLNAVLARTGKDNITDVTIIQDKTLTPEIIGDKTSILDVKATLDDGTKINIEVQLKNVGNMGDRSLFYWSREFRVALDAGQDYDALPRVITINILGAEFFKETEEFHTSFHIREDFIKDLQLTDKLEMHFIDTVKFRRLKDKNMDNPIHRWLTYFDKNTPQNIIQELIKMDRALEAAEERIVFISQDKESLANYYKRERELLDYKYDMKSSREEGKIEGELKGKLDTARNLLSLNVPIEIILKSTGLSVEEIEKLKSLNLD